MTRRLVAALGAVAAASILTAGCGTGAPATPGRSGASPSSTSAASSPSASAKTGLPSGTLLLGLGDSVPGAGGACETMAGHCRSYVLVLADLAAKALGRPVNAVNMAYNNDVTSRSLLFSVRTDQAMREAIGKASIITIQVGNNDWQGPCSWDGAAACLDSNRVTVGKNLGEILDVIGELRGGSVAGVRVVAYADSTYETDTIAADWGVDGTGSLAQLHAMFTAALRALNATTCQVARAHHAVCVDLQVALNGRGGTQSAGLGGIHPDGAGHEKIAAVIARAGFTDVR